MGWGVGYGGGSVWGGGGGVRAGGGAQGQGEESYNIFCRYVDKQKRMICGASVTVKCNF